MEQHRPLPSIHPFHRSICFLFISLQEMHLFNGSKRKRIVDFGNLTVTNPYPKPIDGIMVDMFLLWTWNCSLWSLNIHTKDSCLRVLFGEPASFYWCFKHFLAITTVCETLWLMTKIKIWWSKLLIPPNIKQLQRYSSWWFQPLWKILVNNGNLPQIGVKIKNLWNHHLGPRIWSSFKDVNIQQPVSFRTKEWKQNSEIKDHLANRGDCL